MKKKLDDGQNHLTGPEYEFIRNLLKDVVYLLGRNNNRLVARPLVDHN